jgi:hypothetical protein
MTDFFACQWVYDVAAIRRLCTSHRGWCHELTRQVRWRHVFTCLFRSGNLTLSNAVASFIWTPTCQRTSPVAAIQYFLAVCDTTPGPLFVWPDGSSFTATQLISKQLSVHFSLTLGYSRQFFFLQLPQWCRTAAFQFLSSTPLDIGQAMRIAIIFALYQIFLLVWWRVYKGLEVVIG